MRNVLILAAPALALIATPAIAQSTGATDTGFSVEISHDDLDLTTSEGVSRLDTRIRNNVRQLCDTGNRDVASIQAERECRENATEAAQAQVRFAIAEANAEKSRLAAITPTSDNANPGA